MSRPDRAATTRPRISLTRLLSAGVTVLMTLTALAVTATPAHAETYTPVTGSGSTWSQNALDQWRRNVKSNYGMTVNYSGTGSTQGRRDFLDGTVDFAVSEIPFQGTTVEQNGFPEVPKYKYAYMPIVAGGTSFMYNLKINGRQVTNLRLSGEVVAKIFTGGITMWNDPAIQADNPGLQMPARQIVPVVRSDGSGTTAQFTQWLSKSYGDIWNAYCKQVGRSTPCGLTSYYPTIAGMQSKSGSNGVAGYVKQSYAEGAITYVEYSYAMNEGFPVVKLLNKAGYYVEPTASSVAVALLKARINDNTSSPDYLTQILDDVYNDTDPRTYPLSSYSYMILPMEVFGTFTQEKGRTLSQFGKYFLCEGQQSADQLGYSPLPMNLVLAGLEQVKRIPGAGDINVDINACNNPTFRPGDDPSKNLLAQEAPQPAPCDKQGPTQCTKGTAGAKDTDTPVSNNGGGAAADGDGGSDAGAGPADGGSSNAGTSGDPSGDPSAAANTGDVQYDADGVAISGVSSSVSGQAQASPQSVETVDGWSTTQTLMVIACGLLLGIILGPPLLSNRLSRGRSSE